ncbi:ribose-phosphate pyrophosphokinase [Candidatus Microgenomates bacterium]|nr:ribose-phosphate pyrophosphokinase [Candidatus Microgenomates bacterium]
MVKIFAGSANKPLAEKIAHSLSLSISPLEIHIFPDGEKRARVLESVLDEHCVVVQPTAPPVDANYMELFFIVDALKRSGAKSVTVVISYLGYQRQDHVFREGEGVSLEVVVKTLEAAGVDKVITFDLHTIRALEVFKIPVVHLSALPLFAEKIRRLIHPGGVHPRFAKASPGEPATLNDAVLVSPDMGGVRRIKILSEMLNNLPYAAIVKNRDLATGEITVSEVQGELAKTAIIVDDMIASGSTIAEGVRVLQKRGVEQIFVFATHAVFSADAKKILEQAPLEKIFVTDSIEVPEEKRFNKLETLSVAGIITKELQKS